MQHLQPEMFSVENRFFILCAQWVKPLKMQILETLVPKVKLYENTPLNVIRSCENTSFWKCSNLVSVETGGKCYFSKKLCLCGNGELLTFLTIKLYSFIVVRDGYPVHSLERGQMIFNISVVSTSNSHCWRSFMWTQNWNLAFSLETFLPEVIPINHKLVFKFTLCFNWVILMSSLGLARSFKEQQIYQMKLYQSVNKHWFLQIFQHRNVFKPSVTILFWFAINVGISHSFCCQWLSVASKYSLISKADFSLNYGCWVCSPVLTYWSTRQCVTARPSNVSENENLLHVMTVYRVNDLDIPSICVWRFMFTWGFERRWCHLHSYGCS